RGKIMSTVKRTSPLVKLLEDDVLLKTLPPAHLNIIFVKQLQGRGLTHMELPSNGLPLHNSKPKAQLSVRHCEEAAGHCLSRAKSRESNLPLATGRLPRPLTRPRNDVRATHASPMFQHQSVGAGLPR